MSKCLILLAHGSPDPRHADAINNIADRVSRELGSAWTVFTSYLQHHGPTVTEAFSAARQSVAEAVVIQPLLLTTGKHWRDDVPEITGEATSNPEVQLLEPPDPMELLAAVLETLSPIEPRGRGADPRGWTAEPARNTPMPRFPAMPTGNVVLVAGGSRIQNLRNHFEPLAAEVERSLGQGSSDHNHPPARSVSVLLLTRPTEILQIRTSGPTTKIVPLLVSTGRVYDSMNEAADQIGAKITRPVGETAAFTRAIVSGARNDHGHR